MLDERVLAGRTAHRGQELVFDSGILSGVAIPMAEYNDMRKVFCCQRSRSIKGQPIAYPTAEIDSSELTAGWMKFLELLAVCCPIIIFM